MISIFTIFLLSWLLIGFLVGIEVVFVEQVLSDENIEKIKNKYVESGININEPAFEIAWNIMTNKKSLLAIFTLFGYISLYLSIKGKIKRFTKFITKKRGKQL